jgi:F-type H+-transporting ATPase subunit O
MENFAATFKKDAGLQKILTAPTLSVEDKQQIISELQKATGSTDKTVKQFLETLAANNRLAILEGVSEKFGTLMSAARGEVEMTITSASPLDAKVVRQLENAVSKSTFVGQGKKLKVVPKVCVHNAVEGCALVEVEIYENTVFADSHARRSTLRSVAASLSRSATVPSTFLSRPRSPR